MVKRVGPKLGDAASQLPLAAKAGGRYMQLRSHSNQFDHPGHGLTNREIGEAKKVTKFEVNPAYLSGFWREI